MTNSSVQLFSFLDPTQSLDEIFRTVTTFTAEDLRNFSGGGGEGGDNHSSGKQHQTKQQTKKYGHSDNAAAVQ